MTRSELAVCIPGAACPFRTGLCAVIEDARAKVVALTPPDELREDHDRLALYFDETLAAQRAVVDAATG